MNTDIKQMAIAAKKASLSMAKASLQQKNGALEALIENLQKHREAILQANRQDFALAKARDLSASLLERLSLENRFEGILHDIRQVIDLPDPVGEVVRRANSQSTASGEMPHSSWSARGYL